LTTTAGSTSSSPGVELALASGLPQRDDVPDHDLAGLNVIVIAGPYRDSVAQFDQDVERRRRFPALDPEPPPRPWWRRLLPPAAVAAVAGAVSVAVLLWPSSPGSSGSPAAAKLAGGKILAVTPSGGLALSDADGRGVMRLHGLGNVGDRIAISPMNRYLALFNGQVVIVRPGPALAPYPAKVPLSSETTIAWPAPFADHGRALVMLKDYGSLVGSDSPISVVSMTTGQQSPLGVGEHVAGDPQTRGAFVSVPEPAKASATSTQASPDSRIELRDAARPTVLLATAGGMNRALGEPAGTPVALAAYAAPSGTKVAVTVQPVAGGTPGGIVIVDRQGRALDRSRVITGVQGIPVWSPSGRSLAYLTAGAGGVTEVKVWTPGKGTVTSRLPAASGPYSWCIWSPDARAVLCAAGGGGQWAFARARDGSVAAVRGPGLPVAWLP
jgi:hypothetical protein